MTRVQLPDAARRALRTMAQAFTAVILMQAAAVSLNIATGTWVPDIHWIDRLLLSACAAAGVALVTFVHNWAEDNANLPAVLKATPSGGERPATVSPVK